MGGILTGGGVGYAGLPAAATPSGLNDVRSVECLSPPIHGEAPEHSAPSKSNADKVWFVGSSVTS
jgi:hypothetical protein